MRARGGKNGENEFGGFASNRLEIQGKYGPVQNLIPEICKYHVDQIDGSSDGISSIEALLVVKR